MLSGTSSRREGDQLGRPRSRSLFTPGICRIHNFVLRRPDLSLNSTWTHNPRTGTQSFAHARAATQCGGLEGVLKGAQPDSEITCCRDDTDKETLPRARSGPTLEGLSGGNSSS